MICSGCGKRIRFSGSTCANCGHDTNTDQQAYLLSLICFGILLMGGVLFGHATIGAALGIAVAFAVQIVHRRLQRNRTNIQR